MSKDEKTIYWVVGGALAVLAVIMLIAYPYIRGGAVAEQKAQQLIAAYEAAGLDTPLSATTVARTLGEDGGAVCAFSSDVQHGYLPTRLGVGGEFYFRPTIVDRRALEGYALIVGVYCPEKLPAVQNLRTSMQFTDHVGL